MAWPSPYTPEQRAEAARLLRETDRPICAIAAELGIPAGTVSGWNLREGWRRARPRVSQLSPATWPQARREAVARIYYEPRVAPQDLAEAIGVGRTSATAFYRALGITLRRRGAGPATPQPLPLDAASAADGPALRAALRGHVARQIAAFDAALSGAGAAVVDSARVLRDLGGLKRLLDELAQAREGGDGEPGRDDLAREDAEDGAGNLADDLPALRAALARRLAGAARRGGARPRARRPAGPGAAGAGA